ncbi:unnamed protein product [Clonostachys rosea]|uniref:Uncharacterized protein n=1 Tax=Bionectria ochroleuca TaxID=29856 RepID=A0ABY6V080_BIOOC|nr:unnamed protein product [Clonostachys rosea]
MPLPDPSQHPTPAQVYELAVDYAALLRALYADPGFKFLQQPTAEVSAIDTENTHMGLFWTTDFVQTTYIDNILPFLPQHATRKTKQLGNPWAYGDSSYQWDLTWDAEASALKDRDGNSATFPTLSQAEVKEKLDNLVSRGSMIKKLIFDNESDFMAKMAMGGQTYKFNDEVKAIITKIYS